MIQFRKAERKQAKLRLAIDGPSGSGKTFSALTVAKGMGGKVAVIDTECGSASLYATMFDFDVLELAPPFHPDRYVEAIKAAESAGYDIIIIDSLTHAWSGEGGLLELVDMWKKKSHNGMDAWKQATPLQNKLVQSVLQSKCHILATMRTKTAWEIGKDERTGRNKVEKVGMAPEQRQGMEYEFTLVLDLTVDGHVATASKDRTSMFDGTPFVPTEATGSKLMEWLTTGVEAQAPVEVAKRLVEDDKPKRKPAAKDKPSAGDKRIEAISDLAEKRMEGGKEEARIYYKHLLAEYPGHDSRSEEFIDAFAAMVDARIAGVACEEIKGVVCKIAIDDVSNKIEVLVEAFRKAQESNTNVA